MAGAAEQRFLCLMILARSLSAAGLGLLVSASADLLYQLMRQRSSAQVHQRVQRALTNVATLSTLLDFFLAPAMGRYMDTVGRLATMMLALGCSAGVRLWLAAAPSLPVYLFYRVLVSVTGTAWFGASAAAMSDVFGRGTPGFAEASSRVRRFALVAMMAGTYSGRMIKAPRHAFAIVGLVQLLALSTVGCMKETLKAPAARPQGSFWSFFRQSQALLGFAVLNTAMELPGHVGNLSQVLRRQRFRHWTTAAESTHVLLLQVAAVVSTYLRPRVLELGFASAARLDCWCGALISLNSALAPAAVFLALNPVLACLQCGDLAVELCMEREAAALNLGTGALKAASANRGFVPALVMPRLYGALYSWRPEAPFLVASALSLLAAEVTPRLLARTSIRGSRLAKRSLVQLRAEKVAAGSKLGALKAFLSAAGGLLLRRSKSSRLQDLGSVSGKDFVLRARAEKSPIAVDEEGELDLNPGGEDLHVLLAGREDHDYFCSPVPLRLRFFGQVPEVRVGGQLAFPLVGADRRLPKAFWDTFAAQGAGHDVAELLRAVRAFLLDPAGYLGLADSEAPEARRLQTWCRDAARLNGARLDVVRKYRPQARFPELFDASPLRPEWFPAETWQCLNPGLEGPDSAAWSRILTEHAPKEVYSFPLFTEEFCDMLLEEVFHFYSTGLPARRPNSMNNYGIILSDIGLEPFIDQLQGLLQPMGRELFPGPGSLWDGHHCFIVRYREGEDLGLDMHTDDSDVTFNICLGLDFQGAGLQFCGQVGSPEYRQHALTYQHRKGHCVVHLGKKRHGADDITQGERLNLILWNHSSEYRKSRGYRMPPYAKESAAPDKVCLSYTHDRDFGTFKDYPEGKGHFRGRGWCPPTQAEYPGFKPEMFRASKPR